MNENQIKKVKEEKHEIRICDDKINYVAKRVSKKMNIPIEKAKTELGIGIIMSMMMNRHRTQEISDDI
jgi:hypothetical protein